MSGLRQSGTSAGASRSRQADPRHRLGEAYAAGRALLFLFDYDGTLAPLRPRPEEAHMLPATRRLLARLARRPRVAVGILSGRTLDDLRRMCMLRGVIYVGTGGLEWDLLGTQGVHPRAHEVRRTMATLNRRLAEALSPFAGVWVENKHFALSVHYRQTPDEQVPPLLSAVDGALMPYQQLVRSVPAPKAVEVYPELGWDKGSVVRWLAGEVFGPEALVLYAGDAANDQPALNAVESLGGVSVGVGPEVQATYCVPDPAALYELLASLEAQLPSCD